MLDIGLMVNKNNKEKKPRQFVVFEKVKKGLMVKLIISKEINSRCQIDLIDMQALFFPCFSPGMCSRVGTA